MDSGEHMDSTKLDFTQVGYIRLVLFGHEKEQNAVKELNAVEGGHAHVQEHTVQDGHGDEFQYETQLD